MMLLKAVLYGILEGVTEWLPISSTGHLILLGQVLTLPISPFATELFQVVIQLGAMLAVLVLFWPKLIPFGGQSAAKRRKSVCRLWAFFCASTRRRADCSVIPMSVCCQRQRSFSISAVTKRFLSPLPIQKVISNG